MRNDANPQPDPDLPGTPLDEPRPAMTPSRRWPTGLRPAKVPALLGLVAATSWVVAHWASVWLVPLYLGVMALILCPTPEATRRRRASGSPIDPPAPAHDPTRPASSVAGDPSALSAGDSSSDAGSTASVAGGDAAPGSAGDAGAATATAMKPKRRARPRKTTRPPVEPTVVVEATWVEVGPGKFVRAEGPAPSPPVAGPHLAVDPAPELPDVVLPPPAEAPVDPVPEPDDAPLVGLDDAVDAPAAANDVPLSATEGAWSPPVADVAEGMFAPGLDFRAPTVDGTALQVDGPEGPVYEEEPPFDDAATGDDHAPPVDADWPPPEPVESLDFADLDAGDDLAATAEAPTEPSWPDDDAADPASESWDDHVLGMREDARDPDENDSESGIASDDRSYVDPAVLDVACDDRDDRTPRRPIIRHARSAIRRGPTRGDRAGRPGRPPRSNRQPGLTRRPDRNTARSRLIIRSVRPRSPPRGRSVGDG